MKLALFLYVCLVTAFIAYTTIKVEKLRGNYDRCIEVVKLYKNYVER